jgi:phytoene dehydrogenase-like protein
VLSNATPYHTFLELLPGLARDSGVKEESPLPRDFQHHVRFADYACGAFKINCAVDTLPNFTCLPNKAPNVAGPQHRGTVHFETTMEEIENAHREASLGMPATRPVVEMTIPSVLDNTLAPPGKHVVQLFVQFAPYDVHPKIGHWADPAFKVRHCCGCLELNSFRLFEYDVWKACGYFAQPTKSRSHPTPLPSFSQAAFVHRVFGIVEEQCPGFTSSVLYYDALSPLDLERIFGLHKGNIMHGSLGLHQLGYTRPAPGFSSHRTPLRNLYLCGAGAHPGGGVMGAPGRNCANVVISDLKL